MKMIAAVVAALLMIMPAYADDDDDQSKPTTPEQDQIVGNPPAEFAFMVGCSATQLSLMHLRLQVAASIMTLSAPQMASEVANMVASYKSLADADHKLIAAYVNVVKSIVIPQVTQSTKLSADDLLHKADEMTNRSLTQIASVIDNPHMTFDEQTQLQRLLLQQTQGCETLANKIIQRNTL